MCISPYSVRVTFMDIIQIFYYDDIDLEEPLRLLSEAMDDEVYVIATNKSFDIVARRYVYGITVYKKSVLQANREKRDDEF